MTEAPLSMVVMSWSWPGQSAKDTWRIIRHVAPSSSNESGPN
jgi:hypothetical protein